MYTHNDKRKINELLIKSLFGIFFLFYTKEQNAQWFDRENKV